MKTVIIQKFLIIFCFVAFFTQTYKVQATHIAGGTLTYSHIGGRQYLVKIQLVQNCESATNFFLTPLNILVRNQVCTQSTFPATLPYISSDSINFRCNQNVTNCSGGLGRTGFLRHTWQDTITLPNVTSPNCNEWRITHGGSNATLGVCCMLPVDNIGISGSNPEIFLEAFLKHDSTSVNNGPQFNISHMPIFCVNKPVAFRIFGPESDGDSVVYALVPNKNGLTSFSSYISPTTGTHPFFAVAGSTSIQPTTGLIRFIPTQQQNSWISVLAEEFRQGVKIGETRIALPVLISINGICNLYSTNSFSGCGLVHLPDGRIFTSDTTVYDTIPGPNSCDTIKEYVVNVTPIQSTGQISGAAFVAQNASETYRAQQFAQGSTNTWRALGGIITSSSNDTAVVLWGNDASGSVNIVSIATNGCVSTVQKMVNIGNATRVASLEKPKTSLYPQPAQDLIIVKSTVPIVTFSVFDTKGAKVSVFHPNAENFEVNVQGLSNGLYLVKISYQNQQESQHRLLIQK